MNGRQWYYAIGQQQHGPVSETELIELFRRAALGPETYVWTDGFTNWQKAAQVDIFAPMFSQLLTVFPVAHPRPAAVTVFGILNIIFGSMGLVCLPVSLLATFAMPQIWDPSDIAIIWLIITHIVGLICTVFLLTLGIELLRLRAWARKWSLVYGWFAIVWGVIGSVVNLLLITSGEFGYAEEAIPSALGGTCGGLIGGLIYPVLLIIFMQKQNVKDACVK
jgi:lysylphosphatidylglycerol synthetase-like protein (DUF2156 family)